MELIKIKNTTNIINLTPHAINLYIGDELIATFDSSNSLRLEEEKFYDDTQQLIIGEWTVPIINKSFKLSKEALPEKKDNTYYIVSLPVLQAYPDRKDFIAPNDLVRDEEGKIIGCKSFFRLKQ